MDIKQGESVFEEFLSSCKTNCNLIYVFKNVLKDAYIDFQIISKEKLIDFIGNDGLCNVKVNNINTLSDNAKITVYSYDFEALNKIGYLACYKYNDKFIIKSFKRNHKDKIGDVSKSEQFKSTIKQIGLSTKDFN